MSDDKKIHRNTPTDQIPTMPLTELIEIVKNNIYSPTRPYKVLVPAREFLAKAAIRFASELSKEPLVEAIKENGKEMLYVIIYKSYGTWRSVMPFDNEKDAKTHVEMYLKQPDKDYITDIHILPIPIPEGKGL